MKKQSGLGSAFKVLFAKGVEHSDNLILGAGLGGAALTGLATKMLLDMNKKEGKEPSEAWPLLAAIVGGAGSAFAASKIASYSNKSHLGSNNRSVVGSNIKSFRSEEDVFGDGGKGSGEGDPFEGFGYGGKDSGEGDPFEGFGGNNSIDNSDKVNGYNRNRRYALIDKYLREHFSRNNSGRYPIDPGFGLERSRYPRYPIDPGFSIEEPRYPVDPWFSPKRPTLPYPVDPWFSPKRPSLPYPVDPWFNPERPSPRYPRSSISAWNGSGHSKDTVERLLDYLRNARRNRPRGEFVFL